MKINKELAVLPDKEELRSYRYLSWMNSYSSAVKQTANQPARRLWKLTPLLVCSGASD